MKKLLSLLLAAVMLLSVASFAAADEVGEPFANQVAITLMNSKPEITAAMQAAADIFGAAYNVKIEITETSNPGETLTTRYNSGDAPTISVVDIANVKDLAREGKIVDLGDQPWAAIGGKDMGAVINDVLYGMPLTIEAKANLINKTAIEKITGEAFDPLKYQTKEDFEALLKQLREGGMENPVIINKEDWSIGSHFVQYFYGIQDGTIATAEAFIEKIRAGEEKFIDNAVFNACMDMFDLYMEYNINKQDPLSADYDLNASYLAEGEAAFWINGTWAWPNLEPFAVEGQEYSVMHMPTDAGAQGKLLAQATKFIVIDKTFNTAEQQEAAKKFLNWLIFTAEGQDAMINGCGMVTAFTNIELPPSNPFNVGLKEYIDKGLTCEAVTYLPSDHRSQLSANMQKYLDGSETREEVAAAFDAYWAEHEVNY